MPICAVLRQVDIQVAASTYYAACNRQTSARALRDEQLVPELKQIQAMTYGVYGARKLWKAAPREGLNIGRDQTARLMKAAGLQGVQRTMKLRTTKPNSAVPRWAGIAYVCFIIDAYSRMIVGWRVASNMRTETVLDAIEMARWGPKLEQLLCHDDAGSQFTSIRYGDRLSEIGAVPSIETVGDSYDCQSVTTGFRKNRGVPVGVF